MAETKDGDGEQPNADARPNALILNMKSAKTFGGKPHFQLNRDVALPVGTPVYHDYANMYRRGTVEETGFGRNDKYCWPLDRQWYKIRSRQDYVIDLPFKSDDLWLDGKHAMGVIAEPPKRSCAIL